MDQLGVRRSRAVPQELHTALQALFDAQTAPVIGTAAKGGACGPEPQRAGAVAQAGAGGPGNRGSQLRPQTQGLVRHQTHQLPVADRAAGLQGLQGFDRGRRHFLITPEAIDLGQEIADTAVALHIAGMQITGASGGLQSHALRFSWGRPIRGRRNWRR